MVALASGNRQRHPRKRRAELILDALEQLLDATPLRDLDVEQIATSAGITRTRFYHYYKSKYEAYAALLQRVADQILDVYALPGSWYAREPATRPRDALIPTMRGVLGVWFEHGPVLRESADLWNAIPEIRDQSQRIMGRLTDATAETIERERLLGVAPDGPDARQLAQSLIWQGERLIILALIGTPEAMNRAQLLDIGVALWMRSIYLTDDPAPTRRLTRRR